MADALTMIQKHVREMHWVERGFYLENRGWYRTRDCPTGVWVSPHDGCMYTDEDAALSEMLREFEGK